jgi:hypothetical protein
MLDLLVYLTYAAEAIPLAVCLALALRRIPPPVDLVLIAGAFFVSFLMDTLSYQLNHGHQNTWWVGYVGYPLQFGLLLAVVAQHRPLRAIVLGGLAVGAAASVLRGTLDAPETFVRVVGGLGVCFLVWGVPSLVRVRSVLWTYCGLTIPFVLSMGLLATTDPHWLTAWTAYQLLRLIALLGMTWVLVRKEVRIHGLRVVETRQSQVAHHQRGWVPRGGDDVGGRARALAQAAKR